MECETQDAARPPLLALNFRALSTFPERIKRTVNIPKKLTRRE